MDNDECNRSRFVPDDRGGHYESWFQRANHADAPARRSGSATPCFSPRGRPDAGVGRAVGDLLRRRARRGSSRSRRGIRSRACAFSPRPARRRASARPGSTTARSRGSARAGPRTASRWQLALRRRRAAAAAPARAPLRARLPEGQGAWSALRTRASRARSRSTASASTIDDWRGSQNHNWGSRHTDSLRLGPGRGLRRRAGRLPRVLDRAVEDRPAVDAVDDAGRAAPRGREIASTARARRCAPAGDFGASRAGASRPGDAARIAARFGAPTRRSSGCDYDNPPGGTKICLNSKLARCELRSCCPGSRRGRCGRGSAPRSRS